MTGVISRIVVDRGFGFISPVGSAHSRQLFFHASGLVDGLLFDARLIELHVEFDLEQNPKGVRAVRVRPASSAT